MMMSSPLQVTSVACPKSPLTWTWQHSTIGQSLAVREGTFARSWKILRPRESGFSEGRRLLISLPPSLFLPLNFSQPLFIFQSLPPYFAPSLLLFHSPSLLYLSIQFPDPQSRYLCNQVTVTGSVDGVFRAREQLLVRCHVVIM